MELFFFAPAASWPPTLLAACFGLMIGSFLNVVIYRIPEMIRRESENAIADYLEKDLPYPDEFSLITPNSTCPKCGHKIRAWENIPVISYLFLRGKCSACKTPISLRYPAIELLTGIVSACLIWRFGSGIYGLATLVFTYLLISMTFIDLDHKLLPDDLNYLLLWSALLVNINHTFCSLNDAVIGAAAGYMALYSVNFIFAKLFKKQGMGNGDFKLLAALGAWFGWMALPQIILIASVTGILGFGLTSIFGKKAEGGEIPFGPSLSLAGIFVLLFGQRITEWTSFLLSSGAN
ncbi:MAG: prepilin peptidase [Burkholderiales bacterium]|nr:prepilin peptidase [Burkholderiales bacterium]